MNFATAIEHQKGAACVRLEQIEQMCGLIGQSLNTKTFEDFAMNRDLYDATIMRLLSLEKMRAI